MTAREKKSGQVVEIWSNASAEQVTKLTSGRPTDVIVNREEDPNLALEMLLVLDRFMDIEDEHARRAAWQKMYGTPKRGERSAPARGARPGRAGKNSGRSGERASGQNSQHERE